MIMMVLTPTALAALIQYALPVLLLFVLAGGAARRRVASVHIDYYYDHTPHDNASK